jgi:hypothetical protein
MIATDLPITEISYNSTDTQRTGVYVFGMAGQDFTYNGKSVKEGDVMMFYKNHPTLHNVIGWSRPVVIIDPTYTSREMGAFVTGRVYDRVITPSKEVDLYTEVADDGLKTILMGLRPFDKITVEDEKFTTVDGDFMITQIEFWVTKFLVRSHIVGINF